MPWRRNDSRPARGKQLIRSQTTRIQRFTRELAGEQDWVSQALRKHYMASIIQVGAGRGRGRGLAGGACMAV